MIWPKGGTPRAEGGGQNVTCFKVGGCGLATSDMKRDTVITYPNSASSYLHARRVRFNGPTLTIRHTIGSVAPNNNACRDGTMVFTKSKSNYDEAQPESWDQFWEFIIGPPESKTNTSRRQNTVNIKSENRSGGENDSFLDLLFPAADDEREQTSTRRNNEQFSPSRTKKSVSKRRHVWKRRGANREREKAGNEGSLDDGVAAAISGYSNSEEAVGLERSSRSRRSRRKKKTRVSGKGDDSDSSSMESPNFDNRQTGSVTSVPRYVPPSMLVKGQGPTKRKKHRVSFAPLPDRSSFEDSGPEDISQQESIDAYFDSGDFLLKYLDPWADEYTSEDDSSCDASTKESSNHTVEDSSSVEDTGKPASRNANEIRLQFLANNGNLLSPLKQEDDSSSGDDIFKAKTEKQCGPRGDEQTLDISSEGSRRKKLPTIGNSKAQNSSCIDEYMLSDQNGGQNKGIGRISCCSINNASNEMSLLSRKTGIPVYELSKDELAEIFPKLRMVSDDKREPQSSEVLGNANTFEDTLPAMLQLPERNVVHGSGPQSLYEYDYADGNHMKVLFEEYGRNPAFLKVKTFEKPPVQVPGNRSVGRVVVQVEASTVSRSDCSARKGESLGGQKMALPGTPGVDFVGRIYRIDTKTSKKHGLTKGSTVMSLTRGGGGNSRFVGVDASTLVKIPEEVDPAEAVCLAETYLSAFQIVHYGENPSLRYRSMAMKGKAVFIHGPVTSTLGRAISQLAVDAGVENIYATTNTKHVKEVMSMGIIPLSPDPAEWWEELEGSIDMIVSIEERVIPLHYKLLKKSGQIIFAGGGSDVSTEEINHSSRVACSRSRAERRSKTHRFDLFTNWDADQSKCKKDLSFLVGLLQQKRIEPQILDRVPLSKVARAHELLEGKRHSGFLICEPWLVSRTRVISL